MESRRCGLERMEMQGRITIFFFRAYAGGKNNEANGVSVNRLISGSRVIRSQRKEGEKGRNEKRRRSYIAM